jgi:hypothetical protein
MILDGVIERRLLVNYRIDPDTIARVLPAPFRPRVVHGGAVAGICLIRLGSLRAHGLPPWMGLRSENAAHRVAVEFDTPSGPGHGVYIPRRDSDAWLNTIVGGRLFPGQHHRAHFRVDESSTAMRVAFESHGVRGAVDVSAKIADEFRGSALFDDLDDASQFFRRDSLGYSATRQPTKFDGLELCTTTWKFEPARVELATSTFFDDLTMFPRGTVELDSAFVMRDIGASWVPAPTLRAPDAKSAGECDRRRSQMS